MRPRVGRARRELVRRGAAVTKTRRQIMKTRSYIHTRLSFGEWGVPRRVMQAGIPQGKNYQSPSSGSIEGHPNVRSIYL